MCTHATSRIGETSLQNCQKTKESLGNIGIFLLLKPNFPHTKFDFLQRLPAFFNGFLLSLTAFWFSSTAFQFSSRAFNFPRNQRKSIHGKKYTKDHYLIFCHLLSHLLSELHNTCYNTQHDVYPKGRAASVYRFDLDIYDEFFWMKLKSQVGCVSGCRLVLGYMDERQTLHWKACYKLWCSHRSLFQNNGSSNYLTNNVGPLGWEFQFSVPISGTPIGSGIPILFSIPRFRLESFFEIPMSGESENWNSDLRYLEFW